MTQLMLTEAHTLSRRHSQQEKGFVLTRILNNRGHSPKQLLQPIGLTSHSSHRWAITPAEATAAKPPPPGPAARMSPAAHSADEEATFYPGEEGRGEVVKERQGLSRRGGGDRPHGGREDCPPGVGQAPSDTPGTHRDWAAVG